MPDHRHALVLSGGGALGAYEVGVMKALSLKESGESAFDPFAPRIVTGTSVGAFNASFLAAQAGVPFREAVARLEHVWLQVIAGQGDGFGNGVYRYRLNPFEFLNPLVFTRYPLRTLERLVDDTVSLSFDFLRRLSWFFTEYDEPVPGRLASLFDLSAFISMDPLEETLEETIDFEELRDSDQPLRIAATNWTSGHLSIAKEQEMTPEWGPSLIKGSASIPGIFPPERIGEHTLVDGGVVMNTPLAPAIWYGADQIHVVTLFPKAPVNDHRTLASTIGAMNRAQQYSWDFIVDVAMENIRTMGQIFHDLDRLAQGVEQSPGNKEEQRHLLSYLERVRRAIAERMGLHDKTLSVHRYRPGHDLQDGPLAMLFFGRGNIEELIERGFEDTRHHDCAENGCVTIHEESLPRRKSAP